MHITLRQLQIFEAVARNGSISRAAAELHLTQPAVSMQMKQLEEQVGLPLVEQIGKRLFITEAGQELRGHAIDIAGRMTDLQASMDRLRGLERGQLRLAAVSTANDLLPRLIAAFSRRHPGVRVSLRVANREDVLVALAENSTDLAITGQPPDSADVIAQHFMDNPLVIVASPAHPLAAVHSIALQQLASETMVVREPGSGTRATMERHFAAHGVALQIGCEFGNNESLKQAVRAGLGLGLVSLQSIELELQTRCLVVLPVEGFPLLRHWFVVQRTHKRLSVAAWTFRELLLSQDPAVVLPDAPPLPPSQPAPPPPRRPLRAASA